MEEQYINITLDDSGKLNENEQFFIYGGFISTNKKELDENKRKFKGLIRSIKKNNEYYKNIKELKGNNTKYNDRKRINHMISKNFRTIGLCVTTKNLRLKTILTDKKTRGRYQDFIIKLLVKASINQLISENIINPEKSVKLVLNMDQETKVSNGYYNLKDGIYQELIHGIYNYNFNTFNNPILKNELFIEFNYLDSINSINAQIADFTAHSNLCLKRKGENINFNIQLNLP